MSETRPPDWPAGVKKITVTDLARLGIDGEQQLFWDGKRIEIRRPLSLTGFQKLLTAIVSICAVLGGLGGAVTGYNNLTVYLCARGIDRLSCPIRANTP